MIKETGKIIAIEKQHGKNIAVIECVSKSACSGCHNQSSCNMGSMTKSHADKTHQFEVPYKEGMKVDEVLELRINNRNLVYSAIIAYFIPLVFFIGGAVFAEHLGLLNIEVILIAFGCTAISFVLTRFMSNKLFPKKQLNNMIRTELKK